MVEKPNRRDAPSLYAAAGRYVLDRAIFDALQRIERGAGGEMQLTDAIALLIKEGHPVHVVVHRGSRHDLGNPGGYLKAAVDFALDRDDYGPELRRWLVTRLGLAERASRPGRSRCAGDGRKARCAFGGRATSPGIGRRGGAEAGAGCHRRGAGPVVRRRSGHRTPAARIRPGRDRRLRGSQRRRARCRVRVAPADDQSDDRTARADAVEGSSPAAA